MEADGAANSINKRRCTKCPWEREEDEILTALVESYGVGNWNCIADYIPGRTGQSCRLRWYNQLDPKLDKSPFSEEDQQKLLELQREYGNKWSTIVRFFPGRTDNQLKNQYHVLVGSRCIKASSSPSSSTVPNFEVGSQFSNNSRGFAPHLAGRIEKPLFSGGPSSVYGHPGANCGDFMMSDGNSAVIPESCPAAQPMQGADYRDHQFIDFLGVGTSE